MIRRLLLAAPLALYALQSTPQISPRYQAAMDKVSQQSMRENVKYLASDELEGRRTPSKGLDMAADFIAAHFKRAGLEPGNGDSYFQMATWPRQNGQPVRTVIGLLRGSDPALRDTFILVTAHYDHLGKNDQLEGDKIFNGANDDASGVATVMELASALGSMKEKPKRSVVFMTFWGEEWGLQGSRYYGANPVFPLKNTIAQINLEQVGRTDDVEGSMVGKANITGFDYSDVGKILQEAGAKSGIQFIHHPQASDAFFSRSDNQSLANAGIPAHTVSTGFQFAEYHAPGDHWDLLDYPHMEKLGKTIALALLTLADSDTVPKWNETHARTKRYVEAWNKLHDIQSAPKVK